MNSKRKVVTGKQTKLQSPEHFLFVRSRVLDLTRSVRDNELSLIGRVSVKRGSTVLARNDCR